jgi:hypothetical protein
VSGLWHWSEISAEVGELEEQKNDDDGTMATVGSFLTRGQD